jgi:hypothetical protein
MRNIDKLKTYLKETAKQIRTTRFQFKEAQRKKSYNDQWKLLSELFGLKREYRYHHIAYCELRGRTREQIEQPKDNNLPNELVIQRIKEEYAWTPEEIATYEERKAKREALHINS